MKNEATIDGMTVGGQPSPDELADGRFATVVNLRKDDEPGNDTEAFLAGQHTTYVHVPVTIEAITREDIAKVRAAVDASDGPVLIH